MFTLSLSTLSHQSSEIPVFISYAPFKKHQLQNSYVTESFRNPPHMTSQSYVFAIPTFSKSSNPKKPLDCVLLATMY
jgi:hypothetical protein